MLLKLHVTSEQDEVLVSKVLEVSTSNEVIRVAKSAAGDAVDEAIGILLARAAQAYQELSEGFLR